MNSTSLSSPDLEAATRDGLLHQLVQKSALRFADKIAVADRRTAYRYRELVERASRLARLLRRHGVAPGKFVAICCAPSPDMVVAQLAVLMAGGAYLPLDPRYPRQRLLFMIEDSGAELLIADNTGADLPAKRVFRIEEALDKRYDREDEPKAALPPTLVPTTANDLAYLIYTSGSTGTPKGVMIEHGAIINCVRWEIETFGLGPRDRVSQVGAPSFDMSVLEIWPTLVSGASLHFADRADYGRPGALFRWMAEEAITHCLLPTPLAETLLGETRPAGLSLEKMLVGGDRLHVYPAKDVPFELYNLYGPTEAAINTTCARVTSDPSDKHEPPHIGRPIVNVQVHILDESRCPVPAGVVGELYIGGKGVARGYHNRPDLTRARFIPDPFEPGRRLYRTGDLARQRPDGNIDFMGRIDDQVKLRGHRIELGEIEATLATHPLLQTALATVETSARGSRIVAYAVPVRADTSPSADEILAFAGQQLPAYMVPSQVILLGELPLTPNGKIDRDRLPPAETCAPKATALGSSFTERMARVWARALGLEAVGVSDDFFALGGHSIAALSVLLEVEREIGVRASLGDLIEAPTVEAFCRRLEATHLRTGALDVRRRLPRVDARPDELHEPFPLTDVQHAYWLGRNELFELGGVGIHLYLELEGALDVGSLERALRRVVEHHPMLRAVFLADGRQRILASVPPYEIRHYALRDAAPGEVDAHIEALRVELSHQVFPGDRWPLFDVRATSLPSGVVRLHLSFDALILDGQSLFCILEDWNRLYEDPDRRLLKAATSFRDYVVALQALKQTEAYAEAAAYWKERVPSLPSAPSLPLAVDPRSIGRPKFRRRRLELSPEAWRSLREKAHRAEITETATLLTAYADVLAAFSQSPHFCLNLTLFNRLPLCDEIDHIVGDFTSLILLEVDGRAGDTFRSRAEALKRQLWRDLDHRLYSGIEVLRDCVSHRGRTTMPVVFTSELGFEALGRDPSVIERFGREVESITQTPQVWIDLQVIDRGGRLIAHWDAVEELFPPGLLDAMFDAFRESVERLARDDVAWTSRAWLPFALPGPAIEPALTPPAPDALLQDGFLYWAAKAPERMAIISDERSLRYGELSTLARRVASSILQGAREDEPLIGVVMPKGWQQIVAVLGTLIAGRAYVPLDASLPAERRLALLQRAGIRTVLTLPHLARQLEWPAGARLIAIDERELAHPADSLPAERAAARSTAYVIFTSGSTGVPKGVVIEHRSAVNTIADINERFSVGPSDRVFGVSSLSFDLSVYDIFGPLSAGGALVLPDEEKLKDPGHFWGCLAEHGVTIWNSVPSLMGVLVDAAGGEAAARARCALRLVLMSGDWIPTQLPDKIRGLADGIEIVSLGGATEASIWSIYHLIREVDPSWRSIPYGRALKHQSVTVLDAELCRRPTWVTGELYIGGAGIAQGYLNDPERTDASFVVEPVTGERLYRTGDLGRYLPNGEIEFLGRQDHQVKVNGYRIELGEIEATLQRHPGVEACLVDAPGGARGRRLVGGVVLSDATLKPADLRAYLGRHLPEYMVPMHLTVLPTLPHTPNGKLDRAALSRMCEDATPCSPAAEPENDLERETRRIWGEILGRRPESLDVTRNFFDVGGDSVSAILLRTRLAERFGVDLPATAVFGHPTVRALTELLSRARAGANGEDAALADAAEERAKRRREAALRLRRRGK